MSLERFIRTDRCCCTDLRTGGLIWGWLGIFCNIFIIVTQFVALQLPKVQEQYERTHQSPVTFISTCLVGTILNGCFLYGIFNNKPDFLFPKVALDVIGFCIFAVIALIVTLLTLGVALIILLPIGALVWLQTTVCYSLYRQMVDKRNPRHIGVIYQPNMMPQQYPLSTMQQYQLTTIQQYPANMMPPPPPYPPNMMPPPSQFPPNLMPPPPPQYPGNTVSEHSPQYSIKTAPPYSDLHA